MAELKRGRLGVGTTLAGKRAQAEERRLRIAEMLLDGWTTRKIAEVLGISSASVQKHVNIIREDWKKRAADAFETVNATLIAHQWRNYFELLADYRASKAERPIIKTEVNFRLELQGDGSHKRVPESESVVKTLQPPVPQTSLMAEASACLDKIARLTGSYMPTKVAATTPDGNASAPLTETTVAQQNFIYIDITKDPEAMTDAELEMVWKMSEIQHLRTTPDDLATIGPSIIDGQSTESVKTPGSESTPSAAEDQSID